MAFTTIRRSVTPQRLFNFRLFSSGPSLNHHSLILGKPGGGKGTISKKILKEYPSVFKHLSTGDLLRTAVNEGTDLGKEAEGYMKSGGLVPDELIINLVLTEHHNSMPGKLDHNHTDDLTEEEKARGREVLLLDGFPRNANQATELANFLKIGVVINLDIPDEIIIERTADRWIHPASGRVYSYSYNPPQEFGIDDETGDELIQREDDKPEAVKKRLRVYTEQTAPLTEYYEKQGVLKTFSGTQSDVIFKDVKKFIDSLLKQ